MDDTELLLDMAPDAIVILGDDGNIRLVNVQTETLFGYTRAELLGKLLAILVPERFRDARGGHMRRYFADPRVRPMGTTLELFARRKDGTELPIEVSPSPQSGRDGMAVAAAIRDVSERKRLQAASARRSGDRTDRGHGDRPRHHEAPRRADGGGVGFRSEPGSGSAFWVDLIVHQAPAVASSSRPTHPETEAMQSAAVRRLVLYVEDNPANVVFMRDLMSSFDGIELVTVPTAELGVDLARARKPAIILMDINLPGMSGLDALGALRADPETHHIPVIALTAAASEPDLQRAAQAGFYRYLTKPVNVDELLGVMEQLLVV